MPRRCRRGMCQQNDRRLACILAGAFIGAYLVPFAITSREPVAVKLSKVTKAGFFEVVRTFGTVALRFLTVVCSSLESTFVRLLYSLFAVIEDVLAIAEPIRRPGIVSKVPRVPPIPITPRTVNAIGVRTNDDYSPPALCLCIRCRSERDTKKHEQTENEAANPSHVLSFH